jgi:hypothetical protein
MKQTEGVNVRGDRHFSVLMTRRQQSRRGVEGCMDVREINARLDAFCVGLFD